MPPAMTGSRPATVSISVVLPTPLRPTMATISPAPTASETSRTIGMPP